MRFSRTTILIGIALLGSTLMNLPAAGQSVFVNGGSVFNSGPSTTSSTQSALQFGARTWLTRAFELQAGMTVLSEPSIDAALRFRPFRDGPRIEPYLFTGFGVLFASADYRSVVPAGIGAEYRIDRQWAVNADLSGIWTIEKDANGSSSLMFGVSPTIGVSYLLRRGTRPKLPNDIPLAQKDMPDPRDFEEPEVREETMVMPVPKPGDKFAPVRARGGAVIDQEMTLLPDGMFIMGLADEDPLSLQTAGFKRITVSSVRIDRYETTNKEYREFLDSLGPTEQAAMMPDSTIWDDAGFRFSWTSYFHGKRYDNYPVVGLTFDQALAYCASKAKRLPTEAEWEYAARTGREGGIYPWQGFEARNSKGAYMANFNNGRAGYAADGYAFTAPVNSYSPNEWGLYNMSGNVAEWVEDAYSATYTVLSDFNPFHIDEAEARRVVRGGSWASDEFYIGVGVRDAQGANEASPYVGCRCAADVSEELYPDLTARKQRQGEQE